MLRFPPVLTCLFFVFYFLPSDAKDPTKSQHKWYKFQAQMRRRAKPAASMPVPPVSNVLEPTAYNAPAVPAEKVPVEEIPAKTVQPDVRNVIIQEDRQKEVEVDNAIR